MKIEKKILFTAGIDEAGRGPLAGPVAIGCVKLSKDFDMKSVAELKNKDSKKLSSQKREQWFLVMKQWKKQHLIDFHVALVSNTIIDNKGITYAIKKGIKECLRKVKVNPLETMVLLDGSLKAPPEYQFQQTIIKGDEKEIVIGLASIAAKVTRDQKMVKFAVHYPDYLFDIHKGYGTLIHRTKIKKSGPCAIHRLSFIKNIVK